MLFADRLLGLFTFKNLMTLSLLMGLFVGPWSGWLVSKCSFQWLFALIFAVLSSVLWLFAALLQVHPNGSKRLPALFADGAYINGSAAILALVAASATLAYPSGTFLGSKTACQASRNAKIVNTCAAANANMTEVVEHTKITHKNKTGSSLFSKIVVQVTDADKPQ